jgi:hypothetical protein
VIAALLETAERSLRKRREDDRAGSWPGGGFGAKLDSRWRGDDTRGQLSVAEHSRQYDPETRASRGQSWTSSNGGLACRPMAAMGRLRFCGSEQSWLPWSRSHSAAGLAAGLRRDRRIGAEAVASGGTANISVEICRQLAADVFRQDSHMAVFRMIEPEQDLRAG